MGTILLPPQGGDVHLHIRRLDDGRIAVDFEATDAGAADFIGIAGAARMMIEHDLPDDIRRAEQRAAEQRIRRAANEGRIRKVGGRVSRGEFEAWRGSREARVGR